jgi:hypothetical protein
MEHLPPAPIGERFSGERRVFGEYETVAVAVDDLIRLPQVRSGTNPDLPDLKESIKANGLLNPIDIAVMDEAAFVDYIGFINELWGRSVQVEDYAHMRQPGGEYNLVIAGHTRAEAISQLQAEDEAGSSYEIVCKVHQTSDPFTIISLQLDENIHSKPAPERKAMALVEAWSWGKKNGKWASKAEFLRTDGRKFNARNLNDAIAFAELPEGIRDFVFEGQTSYAASVELGRSVDVVLDYVKMKMGATDDEDGLVDEAYRMKLGTILQDIFNRSLGVKAATTYIKGQVEMMNAALGRAEVQPEIALFSQAEQYRMGHAEIKNQLLAALKEADKLSEEKRAKQRLLQYRLAKSAELAMVMEQADASEHLAA